jgi:hypothetical protein
MLPSLRAYSQDEMDFEEFMGMMSETFTDEQLDELSFLVPWEVRVFGYAYGDFSDDGRDDVVLGIREIGVTPEHSIDVYFFENVNNRSYKLIKVQNVRWMELPVEIAFLVKNSLCFVTSRDYSSWYFIGYKIKDDEIVQVERDVYPINVGKAGE